MGIREAVQPGFHLVWRTVRKNVEAMPADGLEFKPEGLDTRSFREIALHMANATVTFGENIGKTAWERLMPFPPERHTAKAQVLSALSQAGDRFLASLGGLTDEEAARIVRVPWGAEMAQGVVVAAEVPHMFYHNGQLAIYMRMRGVKPLFLER
ncbi:MAG TPA: DinB family protein [bacterium]|nr:DinB family protein [bacterium]